jgi:hypothetical protein
MVRCRQRKEARERPVLAQENVNSVAEDVGRMWAVVNLRSVQFLTSA